MRIVSSCHVTCTSFLEGPKSLTVVIIPFLIPLIYLFLSWLIQQGSRLQNPLRSCMQDLRRLGANEMDTHAENLPPVPSRNLKPAQMKLNSLAVKSSLSKSQHMLFETNIQSAQNTYWTTLMHIQIWPSSYSGTLLKL